MIKYKFLNYEGGVQFLKNRFHSYSINPNRLLQLRKKYQQGFRLGLVISLALMLVAFQAWKRVEQKSGIMKDMKFVIHVDEIPQTIQRHVVTAPTRPSVPIPSEEEDIPEDETITITDLDLEKIPPPPPPLPEEVDESALIFVAYDEPPAPIGGFSGILDNLVYPELGRKARIEGIVILHVQIDDKGRVGEYKVIQSLAIDAFTEAAIKAIRSVKWKPAKQRDRAVTAWISVPIRFILKNEMFAN